MTTNQLVKQLETNQNLLPKDLLKAADTDTLIRQVEEIFTSQLDELNSNKVFKNRYAELVSYLYYSHLSADNRSSKHIFSDDLVQYLLNSPEIV